ncbi:MAG: insulinase family protein, partial [Allosphingosinicella sp.]
ASLAVAPPRPGPPVRFTHQGDADQAYAIIGWSTFGGVDRIAERRALSLAANMIQVRLFERLRGMEGATYSPRASSSTSESFPNFGIFYAAAELRPDRTDLFFRLAREIVADLAARPPEADEYARAINPVLTGIERRVRTNGYWLSAMEGWSRRPELIDQTRSYLADYQKMTPRDVQAAVAAHVADAPDWSLLVLPGAREGAVPAAPAAPAAPAGGR